MPSQSERRRNNLKTGIFMCVAVGAALATTLVMTGLLKTFGKPMDSYRVRFPVTSGVSNIQPGAAVHVGGLDLGKVSSVEPEVPENESQPFSSIIVAFDLRRDIPLYTNAEIHVNAALLGGVAWLEIVGVGTPGMSVAPDTIIEGTPTPGGLLTPLLGPGHATDVVNDARKFTTFLGDVPDRFGARMDGILETTESLTDDAKAVMANVRQREPEWSQHVSSALRGADELMGVGKAFVLEAQEELRYVHDIIADQRPDIDRIVDNTAATTENAKAVSERFRHETMEQFNRLMTGGQEGVDQAVALVDRFRADYETLSVDIGESMSNATLASQQLKLTMAEVRRSPWKLLYRPSADEIEHELLYDAARSYAVATIDLKAAASSLERLMEQYGDRIGNDPELSERVLRVVQVPLEQHTIAQQNLLDLLVQEGP